MKCNPIIEVQSFTFSLGVVQGVCSRGWELREHTPEFCLQDSVTSHKFSWESLLFEVSPKQARLAYKWFMWDVVPVSTAKGGEVRQGREESQNGIQIRHLGSFKSCLSMPVQPALSSRHSAPCQGQGMDVASSIGKPFHSPLRHTALGHCSRTQPFQWFPIGAGGVGGVSPEYFLGAFEDVLRFTPLHWSAQTFNLMVTNPDNFYIKSYSYILNSYF